jgi:aspartyl-tRNA synthetase
MHAYRTHTCGELSKGHVGQSVRLSGWVHRVRDHGGILFIDLRDHYGITQVLADPESPAFAEVERFRAEWVVRIDGEVRARAPELVNPKLATGEIEVYIRAAEVLSQAEELPLPVFGEPEYPEDIRLTYRFLDLRREGLHRRIMLRSQVIESIRRRMRAQGFTEFQTPILTASSPEGARDFLVPSRLHPGKFYALPQAPQQFKQLIMVAGFDRYFQIAPCFRDEDPRADRSPGEFYQLDMEMSFVTQEDVFAAIEPVLAETFAEFAGFGRERPWKITSGGVEVDTTKPQAERHPFRRIPYTEAMEKFGTDKPDLRNPIEMQLVSEHFRGSGFQVFAKILEREGTEIRAIPAPGGGSRAFCDRMNAWAQKEGLPGMGYIFWRGEGEAAEGAGPLARNIGPARTEAIRRQLGLGAGDAAFFVAGTPKSFLDVAAKARNVIAEELGLVARDRFDFCWVVDFPMFEWNEEEEKIDFSHNPFSMPQGGLEALETEHPLAIRGFQYDIVCNGVELSSGAIRNHRPEIMYKAFEIAGYSRAEVEARFGGMLNAFRYGAPPHGGIAPGIDRIVMLLAGVNNIREVIMFPMNQRAEDLLMQAPSEVTPKQLRELHIRIVSEG